MEHLPSWNDGDAKSAIVEFVEAAATTVPGRGARRGLRQRRHALVREADADRARLHPATAAARWRRPDAALARRQPWKAAYEQDYAWFGDVMDEHYAGDDTQRAVLARGHARRPIAGISVDDFEAAGGPFLHSGRAPDARPRLPRCAYAPMVELLRYLEANGFASYIASGGGRDFMRPITQEMYGIPRGAGDRQLDRARATTSDEPRRHDHAQAEADVLDDGPEKPVRIWSRIGRRPLLAAGNSNGDIQMLDFAAAHGQAGARACSSSTTTPIAEFDYTCRRRKTRWSGRRRTAGRSISIKNDWAMVFAPDRVRGPPVVRGPRAALRKAAATTKPASR